MLKQLLNLQSSYANLVMTIHMRAIACFNHCWSFCPWLPGTPVIWSFILTAQSTQVPLHKMTVEDCQDQNLYVKLFWMPIINSLVSLAHLFEAACEILWIDLNAVKLIQVGYACMWGTKWVFHDLSSVNAAPEKEHPTFWQICCRNPFQLW